jgi:hypothetical protein
MSRRGCRPRQEGVARTAAIVVEDEPNLDVNRFYTAESLLDL